VLGDDVDILRCCCCAVFADNAVAVAVVWCGGFVDRFVTGAAAVAEGVMLEVMIAAPGSVRTCV